MTYLMSDTRPERYSQSTDRAKLGKRAVNIGNRPQINAPNPDGIGTFWYRACKIRLRILDRLARRGFGVLPKCACSMFSGTADRLFVPATKITDRIACGRHRQFSP